MDNDERRSDGMTASGGTRKEALRKIAQGAFLRVEDARPSNPRAVEEEARQRASTAKTAGLRELRLRRDAAESGAAEANPLSAELSARAQATPEDPAQRLRDIEATIGGGEKLPGQRSPAAHHITSAALRKRAQGDGQA